MYGSLRLLTESESISFNIPLAKMFGLDVAVYSSEILNIYAKAIRKNKLIEKDFFKLDRKYVENRTTVPINRQVEIDSLLENNKIIERYINNVDIIKINTSVITGLIFNFNESQYIKKLENYTPIAGMSKRQKKLEEVKKSVVCEDEDIKRAIFNWIDAAGTVSGKNRLTPQSIRLFQKRLDEYTRGNKQLALQIIERATIDRYRDCQYAINMYEFNKKKEKQMFGNNQGPQKVASADYLDDKTY
jgi:hypothetical protein